MGTAIVVILGIIAIISAFGFWYDVCSNDGDGIKNLFKKS